MPTSHLCQAVGDLLADQKPELADNFYAGFHPGSGDVQPALNRYFRLQLANAPVPTLDERECLIDDLSPEQWLKYFKGHVLPTLVRFNLPA